MTRSILFDERSRPPLRRAIGNLMSHAETADFAVGRVRLAGIDLSAGELARIRRFRVLVGRIDADTFAEAEEVARRDPARRATLRILCRFLNDGRLRIRTAGRDAWTPDFSILRTPGDRTEPAGRTVALIGAHYFTRPHHAAGPSFTCVITSARDTVRVAGRFDDLWARAYDVRPVVRDTLERLLAVTAGPQTPVVAEDHP